MILQNLTRAIRSQNYYAVFLEFVIVILGVVIGFQINAWNEGRSEQAAAEAYLNRIAADLQSDGEKLDAAIARFRGSAEDARTLSTFHNDADTPPPDYGLVLVRALWWRPHEPSYPSLDALIGAGDLGVIEDADLVAQLMDIQSRYDPIATAQAHMYRELDAYLYEEYVDVVAYQPGLNAFTGDATDAPIGQAAFDRLRVNLRVENGLTLLAFNYDYLANILEALRADIAAAQGAIERAE